VRGDARFQALVNRAFSALREEAEAVAESATNADNARPASAQALSILGVLTVPIPPVSQALGGSSGAGRTPVFKPRELAHLVHGLAAMSLSPGAEFVEVFTRVARGQLKDFDAEDLAMTVIGLSSIGTIPSAEFLEAFCNEAALQLDGFTSRDLGMTIKGLVRGLKTLR
jgi:hypothetical protein